MTAATVARNKRNPRGSTYVAELIERIDAMRPDQGRRLFAELRPPECAECGKRCARGPVCRTCRRRLATFGRCAVCAAPATRAGCPECTT